MKVIIAEKSSQADEFAVALGGNKSARRGTYQGQDYLITHLQGHLFEMCQPHDLASTQEEAVRLKSWALQDMPWDHRTLQWKREQADSRLTPILKKVTQDLKQATEIIIGTDVDSTGEGFMLAAEVLEALGYDHKDVPISRMKFLDQAPSSVQKGFMERETIPVLSEYPEYRKADFRAKFDYLLGLQSTRVATSAANIGVPLRQGKLKSAIVLIVGDQWEKVGAYKKIPSYQRRFRDENDVLYTDPEQPVFPTSGQVPEGFHASAVVSDKVERKTKAPNKMLDLAELSGVALKRGIPTKKMLDMYQRMYEALILSYPRTDDKTITHEQFKELLPLCEKIATVVGVDPALLTHRQPRPTHVKDVGAHGANRPGVNVPSSLQELDARFGDGASVIYDLVARSYLATLAEDYVYERHTGHVADYPSFVGSVNVPVSAGYRAVLSDMVSEEEGAEEETPAKGLGTRAEPIVHEGFPPRPATPTISWLQNQLLRFDVGTGATRAKAPGELQEGKAPLLMLKNVDHVHLTENGAAAHLLLEGTKVGDIHVAQRQIQAMRGIEAGTVDPDEMLAEISEWIRHDIPVMVKNAESMRSTLGLKPKANYSTVERFEGIWNGQSVRVKREAFGHRFTDQEVQDLLDGKDVSFDAVTKDKKAFRAEGRLRAGVYEGKPYVAFMLNERDPLKEWAGHQFTDEERQTLTDGGEVYRRDFRKKDGGRLAARVRLVTEKGKKKIEASFDVVPVTWAGYTFSDEEVATLEAGGQIPGGSGFVKKAGGTFSVKGFTFGQEDGTGPKKLIPIWK